MSEDHYDDLDRAGLIRLCEQQTGRIAELESGIANELEDIRLEVQARDAKIADLNTATVKLQQSLSETQQLCVELEQERDRLKNALAIFCEEWDSTRTREYGQRINFRQGISKARQLLGRED